MEENLGDSEEAWRDYQDTSYGAARFKVSSWHGVQLSHNEARVSVQGIPQYYLWSGDLRKGPEVRYQLSLTRKSDDYQNWRIVKESATTISGGP